MLNIYKYKKNNLKKIFLYNKGNIIDQSKYYPSFNNEWSNSVYFFNKNNEINLSSIDKFIINIIKSYFFMFSSSLENSVRIRKKPIWKRRFKLNKILFAKPLFKHTNDKVIITLFIYNRELTALKLKINKLKGELFTKYFSKIFINNLIVLNRIKILKSLLNKINTLKNSIKTLDKKILSINMLYKNNKLNKKSLKNSKFISLKQLVNVWNKYNNVKFNLQNKSNDMIILAKSLSNFERNLKSKNSVLNQSSIIITSLLYLFKLNNVQNVLMPKLEIKNLFYLDYFKNLAYKMRLYIRINRIIKFNKFKFSLFIKPLKMYIEKLYNKSVDFNIINLKTYHLNSSLLTEVISIKLRNRKNKILKVFTNSLSKIKLPINKKLEYSNEISRDSNIQNIIIRKYLNKNFLYKNPVLSNIINNKKTINKLSLIKIKNDKLDMIIKSLYNSENTINTVLGILKRKHKNIVLDTLKNKSIGGIRIEASGRLSKRIGTDRSMTKIKQIGTIRNINSSYKRIPSVLLRGNFKSNLQYSKRANKTRLGSFGIKGWVSSI